MSLASHLIGQLDAELENSRRVIERITPEILDWTPHEKSMDTLTLATHVANLWSWGTMILTTEELDFQSEEMKNWTPPTADDVEGVLKILEDNVAQLKSVLADMSDADLEKTWTMRSGDQVFEANPRAHALTRWVLSHQSHHRGQLTVYLRLNDLPLPSIFGPSADEQEM